MCSSYVTGWGFPYDQWPQDLKDQYAYNPTAAKKLLADAGITTPFNTDIVVDTGYDMGLLEIVKSYFAAIGVNMNIRTLDYASWIAQIQTSHKMDQLSSVSAGGYLGKTVEPMNDPIKYLSTTVSNTTMTNDPVYDAFYPQALAATTVDQAKQVIKNLCEHVSQQHYTISLLQPSFFCLVQPWLKGYNGQNNALSGSYGPSLLFFYPARFWIDQGMKKSMGH